MEKPKNRKKQQAKNTEDDLLSIPGIKEALEVVREHAWDRAAFDAWMVADKGDAIEVDGDSVDVRLEEIAHEAGYKIAEIWNLPEDVGETLADLIYWREATTSARRSYLLPFVLVTKTKDPKVALNLGDNRVEFEKNNAFVMKPKGIRTKRIYLDVTYLPYKSLAQAYKAVVLCRKLTGIAAVNLKEGAHERIDAKTALECFAQARRGKPGKEIAKDMGIPIYTTDNPSGSYPLLRKYLKRGGEIQAKLDDLESYLIDLDVRSRNPEHRTKK